MAAIRKQKDQIVDQMLRTAARVWGLPANENISTFDPLIRQIIEACAAELERIGYDIDASHQRLLDKLANLILPEAMLGPKPGSGVMHAMPVEPSASVDPLLRFYSILRRPENRTQDISFSPIGEFKLLKAELAYTFMGGKLFKISSDGFEELLSGMGDAKDLSDELWLVIKPDDALKSLKGLSLFFDLHGHSEAGNFYTSLQSAEGFINGKDAQLEAGFQQPEQFELALQELLHSGDDYTLKNARRAAGIWSKHFLYIGSDTPMQELISVNIPKEWGNGIDDDARKVLEGQQLVYLRIHTARHFQQEVLETAGISINAFPVLNRRLHTLHYRTDSWINIIPIRVEDSFLDLHSITGAGNPYRFRASGDQDLEEGEALLRNVGMGRPDSRELRGIIASLTEAIRDESAFFNELNNEFIRDRLREISKTLARLEDTVGSATDSRESYQYILLRPYRAGEQLSINYWTTSGPDAHEVKAGTALTPPGQTLVNAKACHMLTGVFGGEGNPGAAQRRIALKQQLQSRGKIVSAEDVRLLCLQIFGERLKAVEVRKGVQTGASSREGFMRSIDVMLSLTAATTDYGQAELDYLRSELEHILHHAASPVYPFRVLIV